MWSSSTLAKKFFIRMRFMPKANALLKATAAFPAPTLAWKSPCNGMTVTTRACTKRARVSVLQTVGTLLGHNVAVVLVVFNLTMAIHHRD